MIGPFRRRVPDPAEAILAKIVAQARQPAFYASLGVDDSLDGRFEMILLHAFLYLHRLKSEGAAARATGQRVFDLMFRDLDRNLREMGVSYLGVPRRVKAMGRAFYGRTAAYDAALAGGDAAPLEDALLRNVYGGRAGAAGSAKRLAAYVRAAAQALRETETATLVAAGPNFPDPGTFAG
jgi:cytochrome b pre-mRNA-processing protein 3